jgi:hypothetical protein
MASNDGNTTITRTDGSTLTVNTTHFSDSSTDVGIPTLTLVMAEVARALWALNTTLSRSGERIADRIERIADKE